MKFKIILFFSIVFLISFSCRKSKLNPHCWGEKKEGVFLKETCGINGGEIGYVLIDDKSYFINESQFKKLPNIFRKTPVNEKVDVAIKFQVIDEICIGVTCDCGGIKIQCIQKR